MQSASQAGGKLLRLPVKQGERDSLGTIKCRLLGGSAKGRVFEHCVFGSGEPRARILPITPAMREVLMRQMKRSKGKYVFAAIDNPRKPLSDNTLSGRRET